jgi:hypothetical protein
VFCLLFSYRMPFYIPLPISNIFKINKEQTSML